MMKCQFCDRDVVQPFQCSYCGGYFCAEHRLPESHSCLRLPKKPPFWYQKRKLAEEQATRARGRIGVCPKCSSGDSDMVDYDAKTMTFVCKKCGHKWIQLKAFPHDIIKPKEITSIPVRVMPTKTRKPLRVAGFLLIGLVVGVAIGSFSWHFLIALPNIQRWQQQAIQLKTDLDTAIKEKDALEINLRDLQSEITKLEKEKDSLEQETSSLELKYNVLETHYKNLQTRYEDLDRKYEELFSDYDWVKWVLTDFFDRPLVQKEVPSTSNVRAWLSSDRTDRFRYAAPDFVCGDFAVMLAIHTRAKHWDMGVIAIWGYETETYKEFNHAFNAIITKAGLIYVEPQTDEVWWYENHEEIRKGKTYGIWTYETVDVYIEDVQIILSY